MASTDFVQEFVCRLCGARKGRLFLRASDRFDRRRKLYSLIQCSKCGLVSLFPLPPVDLREKSFPQRLLNPFFYFENSHRSLLERTYNFFHPYSLRWRQKQAEKIVGTGRLLDVGCGNGDFLYEMRQKLWDVVGIESRKVHAQFARETLALTVYSRLEEAIPRYKNSFDLVTFWHTFGFFHDFRQTLEATEKLLHPDGWVLLGLPNWRSLDFWLYKQNWAPLDAPRRIYHFSKYQIRQILRDSPFRLVKTKVIPFDIYYNTLLSERLLQEAHSWPVFFRYASYGKAFFVALLEHILSISGSGSGILYLLKRR